MNELETNECDKQMKVKMEHQKLKYIKVIDKLIKYVIKVNHYKEAVLNLLSSSYIPERIFFMMSDLNIIDMGPHANVSWFMNELENDSYFQFDLMLEKMKLRWYLLPKNDRENYEIAKRKIFELLYRCNYEVQVFRNYDRYFITIFKELFQGVTGDHEKYKDVENTIKPIFDIDTEHEYIKVEPTYIMPFENNTFFAYRSYNVVERPKNYLSFNDYAKLIYEFFACATDLYSTVKDYYKFNENLVKRIYRSIYEISKIACFNVPKYYEVLNKLPSFDTVMVDLLIESLEHFMPRNSEKVYRILRSISDYCVSFKNDNLMLPSLGANCRYCDYTCLMDIETNNLKLEIEKRKDDFLDYKLTNLHIDNPTRWCETLEKANDPDVKIYNDILNKMRQINQTKIDEHNREKKVKCEQVVATLECALENINSIINDIINGKFENETFVEHIDEYIEEQKNKFSFKNIEEINHFMIVSGYEVGSEFLMKFDSLRSDCSIALNRLKEVIEEQKEKKKREEQAEQKEAIKD